MPVARRRAPLKVDCGQGQKGSDMCPEQHVSTPIGPNAPAYGGSGGALEDFEGTSGEALSGSSSPSPMASRSPQPAWDQPKPLPLGLAPVVSFLPEFLPSTIAPWVMDISDRMQCPSDFVAVAAMAALGSLIGRQIGIRPKPKDPWTVVPNMWALIVGRPGVMKSPAIAEALAPLKVLEAQAREAYKSEVASYQAEERLTKLRRGAAEDKAKKEFKVDPNSTLSFLLPGDPQEPKRRRFIVVDATYEALGTVLAENPNGVLVYRDEAVSLLNSLGREDNAPARGFFLSGWSGTDAYTFDRIIRRHQHIPAACISLLGSTQPGPLASHIGRAIDGGDGDDGMIQRFSLLVWPDHNKNWRYIDRAPDPNAKAWADYVFYQMCALDLNRVQAARSVDGSLPYLKFEPDACDLFIAWLGWLEQRLRSEILHPALESHLGKYRKLVPALALINHLAEGGGGSVTKQAHNRAITFSAYLEIHAHRAYGAGTKNDAVAAHEILKHHRKGELMDGFTQRDVHQRDWSNLMNKAHVRAGLEMLVDYNWLAATDIPTGGRPKTIYSINPEGYR